MRPLLGLTMATAMLFGGLAVTISPTPVSAFAGDGGGDGSGGGETGGGCCGTSVPTPVTPIKDSMAGLIRAGWKVRSLDDNGESTTFLLSNDRNQYAVCTVRMTANDGAFSSSCFGISD